jgi:DNA recombination protein RmuC
MEHSNRSGLAHTRRPQPLGTKIGEANNSYKEAFSKLATGPGNLVRQVEMLRELGLKPKKKLKPKLLEEAGVEELELELEQSLALGAGADGGSEAV